ncbi:hypothetical protein CY35_03G021900 [Sphagnum magellanicum]|jgi:hypothetical protein|nr:hypothetical protein CY35_03G021900 [Sphagnum magellanicum]
MPLLCNAFYILVYLINVKDLVTLQKNCPRVPTGDGKGSDVSRQQSWSEKVSDLSRSSNLQSKSANGSVNQKNQATMGSGEGFKASSRVLMSSPAHSVSWPNYVLVAAMRRGSTNVNAGVQAARLVQLGQLGQMTQVPFHMM